MDGVFANYSRKKAENHFSKLTDGHLDSRNPIIQVGGKSGLKRVGKESLIGSPSSSLSPGPAPPSPIPTWFVFCSPPLSESLEQANSAMKHSFQDAFFC